MLFKDYHIPMIRSGSKTVTRREWADGYARPNVGSVQIASDEMFTSDDEADCYIRILDIYDQPLGEMDDEDARKEGDYDSLDEFRNGYEQVYGDGSWAPEKVVTVVDFEYAGRERPRENERIVTDGGTSTPSNDQGVSPSEGSPRHGQMRFAALGTGLGVALPVFAAATSYVATGVAASPLFYWAAAIGGAVMLATGFRCIRGAANGA